MRRSTGWVLLAILIFPLGVASLWASYGPGHVAEFVPWLAAGWGCVACGLVARRVAAWSLEGVLLVAVGLTWLLPDLSTCLNIEPLSHRCVALNTAPALAGAVSWLWLGVLGHAVVAFADGRASKPPLLFAAIAAYALALAIGVGATQARPLLAVLLIVAPFVSRVVRHDDDATTWVASTVAGVAVAGAVLLDPGAANALEAGVVVASLSLLAGLVTIARSRASLTADRAVELGPALANALGDPTFRLAVRAPDGDGWLSTSGSALPAPAIGDIASTAIVRDGIEIARLTHDGSTLADPDIRAAVVTAVEMEAHNTRLRASLVAQAEALSSSRRRLVDAGLLEREALGREVEVEVMLRLDRLARDVQAVPRHGLATEAAERLRRAAEAIGAATAEVENLARGVYPSALADRGLIGALRELAATMPIDVRVEGNDGASGGPETDATLYFLCAEALTNAARHARASSVRIEVTRRAAELAVRIEDDGAGGADPAKGTGLRGLRDRVEALAGTLVIESVAGMGTRLVATIPVGHEAP